MDVDPRELTAGFMFENRNLGTARGVLRDGSKVIWTCSHRPHPVPIMAGQCAEAELERRRQGAQEVLWLLHCVPCSVFWDLAPGAAGQGENFIWLARGRCPQCNVPGQRVRVAILERQESSVR